MIHVEHPRRGRGRRSRRLQDAFLELNLATAVRERTVAGTPAHAAAIQRERQAAERVEALIDPGPRSA